LTSGLDLETEINIRVYEFANPGVVAVRVLDEDIARQLPDIQPFFFDTGEGSGFVLDDQGHIVTNRHVVQNARNVVVQFYDGIQAPATIVGTDRDSDLAVLKVDPAGLNLRPLPLGSMDDLKVGMRVLVIGNPFGNANTLTTGIVSALGRQIELPDSQFLLPEVIQTDAAINPGNSGGPILNDRGEVIGVAFMLQSATPSSSGIGFGIPVYFVERVTKAIIATGKYEHPWLGVRGSSLSPFIVRELDLPVESGVLVAQVIPDGPAAKAGVRGGNRTVTIQGLDLVVGGDIIVAIDDRPIRLFDDLLAYLSRYTSPGQRVVLKVVRDGETLTIPVILEARPEVVEE
jgi:2-alkenal reductase